MILDIGLKTKQTVQRETLVSLIASVRPRRGLGGLNSPPLVSWITIHAHHYDTRWTKRSSSDDQKCTNFNIEYPIFSEDNGPQRETPFWVWAIQRPSQTQPQPPTAWKRWLPLRYGGQIFFSSDFRVVLLVVAGYVGIIYTGHTVDSVHSIHTTCQSIMTRPNSHRVTHRQRTSYQTLSRWRSRENCYKHCNRV